MRVVFKPLLLCCFAFALRGAGPPASLAESPEDFRIEITGSAWLVDSEGTIQGNGAPINLVSDLGAAQRQPTFYGRLVYKPRRKQRLVVEGTPIGLSGINTVDRTLVYRGRTFDVNETLRSSADLDYLFAGYQYDVLSNSMGHLGFSIGGAYLGAAGAINEAQSGASASKAETLGLPLVGAEFRVFPIPHHQLIEVEGGLRGMGAGSYGHFVEGSASGGVRLGPVGILAGYREMLVDFHETGAGGSGIDVRLKGPVFSILWRW